MDGIILLDKPSGITSAHALNKIKRKLNIKKLGHAGTLDPDATGLLVCLAGKATKLASKVEAGEKIYSGIIKLGVETHSADASGDEVSRSDEIPNFPEVEIAVQKFIGEIEQIPPAVSALKVDGKRAYQLVREGITPVLAARKITVFSFEVEQTDLQSEIRYCIRCSKGTYIRAIARDLGRELGCGAHLKSLRREASSPFSVTDAVTIEELTHSHIKSYSGIVHNVG